MWAPLNFSVFPAFRTIFLQKAGNSRSNNSYLWLFPVFIFVFRLGLWGAVKITQSGGIYKQSSCNHSVKALIQSTVFLDICLVVWLVGRVSKVTTVFFFGVLQSENTCSRLRRNVSLYLRIYISCILNCQGMETCKIYQLVRRTNILHELLLWRQKVNLVWALLEV